MTYRTILLPLASGVMTESPIKVALRVAEMFEAHVEVLHVRPDPRNMIPYVGEGMSGALIEEVMTAADKEAGDRAVQAHRAFHRFAEEHRIPLASAPQRGLSAEWREESGREDEVIAFAGRVADLIVVSRPLGDAEVESSAIFETALFETGQALLVAPPARVENLGQRIMIAWNGSPEAARAVTSALPFLDRSEAVRLMSVAGWAEGPGSVASLARRLAWRDIHAEVEALDVRHGSIGETVTSEAARWGADMIVMGAYTQSRFRQMILGGVTRHVLSTATLPLLMAH